MTKYISYIAVLIALLAILRPYTNRNIRAGYNLAKKMKKFEKLSKQPKDIDNKYLAYIDSKWYGSAWHVHPLMNHSDCCLIDIDDVMKKNDDLNVAYTVTVYTSLSNFMMISDNTYKLLLEDPTSQIWTNYLEIDREFIELNLDYIVKVNIEVVNKETTDGIVHFSNNNHETIYNVLSIEGTDIPCWLI